MAFIISFYILTGAFYGFFVEEQRYQRSSECCRDIGEYAISIALMSIFWPIALIEGRK
jgi:hypothetical protein